ncbi:hypothetical protein CNR22_22330 [Sphingobacteriaceae bacterium]|nr:hypothetical protein CNR22_22330 [Sphingobacteriaceae bacterium]
MKKILLTFCLITVGLFAQAQTNLFSNLKRIISETAPEINIDNKLIAMNVWSLDNMESREANKSFEKAYGVYEVAILKGGRKGLIVLAINKDELTSEAVITLKKDGVTKMISVKLSELPGLDANTSNLVFDKDGNEIYRNLSSPNVFSSINHLITR